MEYAIGTQYIKTHGKVKQLCTVVDVWKTYDSKGELVKLRYVTSHEFCGQLVNDYNVVPVTIAKGLVSP